MSHLRHGISLTARVSSHEILTFTFPHSVMTYEEILDQFESGEIRSANPTEDGNWKANVEAKKAILEAFKNGTNASYEGVYDGFVDKHNLPPRYFTPEDGVRLVPGGSSVRRGAYVAPGVIIMPPAYINVGAFVDEGSMVDSHALVGSCAQIGKNVHLSAGVQIGGVLEPIGMNPVIIEDDCFIGTDQYTVDDLPDIDYLIISHDHYDHLDHQTITQLRDKVSTVFCGLGVGSHFTHWGYSDDQINEQDWHDVAKPDSAITIHTLPARHFSGRGFARKNTLWASYLVQTPSLNIYIGGDSGFGEFFAEIGEQFGSIDLAILDNGQYNDAWREIHLHPEEVLQAARHLKAKRLFPVHSSKFVLAMHPWDEPLYRLKALNRENPIPLVTPLIGEKVNLADPTQSFESWWEGLD